MYITNEIIKVARDHWAKTSESLARNFLGNMFISVLPKTVDNEWLFNSLSP